MRRYLILAHLLLVAVPASAQIWPGPTLKGPSGGSMARDFRTGETAQMIGNIIERALLAPNQPLAAAFTLWPIAIMVVYLTVMGRLGALRNL